jgi:pimeloyl-ACP methyl ester carboxylesterase
VSIVDIGSGPAIVLVPGIQGRWEWMRPAVKALAAQWRVVTRSLPGEPGEERMSAAGFDQLVAHVDRTLDEAHLSTAVICGVSFGGLIALRYAARHPERVRALILVSAPGPRWTPAPAQARHLRRPILSFPLFAAGALGRARAELRATLPDTRARLAFYATWAGELLAAPGIPSRMGCRARLAAHENFEEDCARIAVPTLVIAGEQHLDRVVSFDDAREYHRSIHGAQLRVFERTGHLGTASAPDRFAAIVSTFLRELPD